MTNEIGSVGFDIFTNLLCLLWKKKLISNAFFLSKMLT